MRPYFQGIGGTLLGSALLCGALSCGGDDSAAGGSSGGAQGGGGTGGGTIINSGGGGGSYSGYNDASLIGTDGSLGLGGGVAEIPEDAACATETQQGQRIPLTMYVLLDSSASMLDALSNQGMASKWDATKAAITTFVNDPASTGLSVGLQYFPVLKPNVPASCMADTDCVGSGPCDFAMTCDNTSVVTPCTTNADCPAVGGGPAGNCVLLGACQVSGGYCAPVGIRCAFGFDRCVRLLGYCHGRDSCDNAAYAMPAIEVAPLPGAAQPIIASMAAHTPDGLTPTLAALGGGFDYARARAMADPTQRVVLLLATDGFPTECSANPDDLTPIQTLVSSQATGTPPISTFVIGVFSPAEQAAATTNLNSIAKAGGTGSAFIINTSQNVQQAFLEALNKIRGTLLTCEFKLPQPEGGQLDPQLVNVRYTSNAGQSTLLGNVPGGACDPNKGGWHYDNDQAPTKIQLCDSTCSAIQADQGGSVKILLGCKTVAVVN
jgi:hypothetical protein